MNINIFDYLKETANVSLTPQQLQAAQTIEGPVLLLAVPGAGKTTVMVARIANMIFHHQIDPGAILTITFSKAVSYTHLEEGTIGRTNGKVIGYLKQNSGLANGKTIQQEMEAVFADLLALRDEIDALQKKMAQVHDDPAAYLSLIHI